MVSIVYLFKNVYLIVYNRFVFILFLIVLYIYSYLVVWLSKGIRIYCLGIKDSYLKLKIWFEILVFLNLKCGLWSKRSIF